MVRIVNILTFLSVDCFIDHCLSFFLFGHCLVCPSDHSNLVSSNLKFWSFRVFFLLTIVLYIALLTTVWLKL
jgi:hypothetical protein